MGWLRCVGSLKLQVSFAEYSLFYRALLQLRPLILRSLLIVATPYHFKEPANRSRPIATCTPYQQNVSHQHGFRGCGSISGMCRGWGISILSVQYVISSTCTPCKHVDKSWHLDTCVSRGVLQYFAMCCSVLQCVAVCCSVLQCVSRASMSVFKEILFFG